MKWPGSPTPDDGQPDAPADLDREHRERDGDAELAGEDVVETGVARIVVRVRVAAEALLLEEKPSAADRAPPRSRRGGPVRCGRPARPAARAHVPRPDRGTRCAPPPARRGSDRAWRPSRAAAPRRRASSGPRVSSPARGGCRRWRAPSVCSSSASASVRRAAAARHRLGFGRDRQPQQQPPAQLVVVALVGLDRVAVERRGLPVPHPLAELDELPVLHDRDGLARELAGRHALDGGRQRVEIAEERPAAAGQRIERGRVDRRAAAGARRSAGSAWPRRRPGGPARA